MVTPKPSYPGERQEAENLPRQQLEKAYRHEEMPESIFYPCFLSLKNHVWNLPKFLHLPRNHVPRELQTSPLSFQ